MHGLELRFATPQQAAQVTNYLAGAPAVALDVGQYLFDLLPVCRAFREKLQRCASVAHHRAQRLIELVCDRARQGSCHGSAAEVRELVSLLLKLGQRPRPFVLVALAISDVERGADDAVTRSHRLAARQEPANV